MKEIRCAVLLAVMLLLASSSWGGQGEDPRNFLMGEWKGVGLMGDPSPARWPVLYSFRLQGGAFVGEAVIFFEKDNFDVALIRDPEIVRGVLTFTTNCGESGSRTPRGCVHYELTLQRDEERLEGWGHLENGTTFGVVVERE